MTRQINQKSLSRQLFAFTIHKLKVIGEGTGSDLKKLLDFEIPKSTKNYYLAKSKTKKEESKNDININN